MHSRSKTAFSIIVRVISLIWWCQVETLDAIEEYWYFLLTHYALKFIYYCHAGAAARKRASPIDILGRFAYYLIYEPMSCLPLACYARESKESISLDFIRRREIHNHAWYTRLFSFHFYSRERRTPAGYRPPCHEAFKLPPSAYCDAVATMGDIWCRRAYGHQYPKCINIITIVFPHFCSKFDLFFIS